MTRMPPLPNEHALAVLALTVVALYLFTRERIPLETSSTAGSMTQSYPNPL